MSGRMFFMPVRNRCLSCLLTSVFVTSAVLLGILFFHFRNLSISVSDITYFWQTEPIVSVYVPSSYQGNICSTGYEPVSLDYMAIQALSSGPCGCAQNTMSYNSTTTECPADWEESEACMSLSPMSGITSTSWRGSTICILRGGKPAATYLDHSYWSRPHPDSSGQCPSGYRKCGAGDSQDSAAICFPVSSLCPITSMIVLPSESLASDSEDWESVGVFPSSNHTLYARREQPNELPIIDIVARLTELTPPGENLRGQCYEGNSQTFDAPLISDPVDLWTYTTDIPQVCEKVDSRYLLGDAVDLQGHFLENLQLTQPTCALFDLYPTYETRYNVSTDPDYLNSGVKCDFTSQYTCVRDPYQHTNCVAGDDICDGVVNQNICGEYAHAVRSALANFTTPNPANNTNRITLGLYYARESVLLKKKVSSRLVATCPFWLSCCWSLGWSGQSLCCAAEATLECIGKESMTATCCSQSLPACLLRAYSLLHWHGLFSGGISIAQSVRVTAQTLLQRICCWIYWNRWYNCRTWLFAVCKCNIGMTCCPIEDPADRVDSADDAGIVAEAIERHRVSMYLRLSSTSTATYHDGSAHAPPIATVQATTVTPVQATAQAQLQRQCRPVSSRASYTPPAAPQAPSTAPDPLRPALLLSPQASNKPPPPARTGTVGNQSRSDVPGYPVFLNDYL